MNRTLENRAGIAGLFKTSLPLLLVFLMYPFAWGCGGKDGAGDENAPDSAVAEATAIPMYVVVPGDPALVGASMDSVTHRLGPGLTGRRLVDEPGFWAVDFSWFFVPKKPIELLTFAEMDALAEQGGITESTVVGVASYRIKVAGESPEEAGRNAVAGQPPSAPRGLYEALKPAPVETPVPSEP